MLGKRALGVVVSVVLVAAACGGSKGSSGGNTGGASTGTGTGNATSSTGGSTGTGTGGTAGTSSSGASTTSSGGTTTSSSGSTTSSSGSTTSSSTSSSSSTTSAGSGPTASGCPVFTATSPWNTDISGSPVDPNSAAYIATIDAAGGNGHLHADFGTDLTTGIPYQYVNSAIAKSPVTFDGAPAESDVGPYPIPPNPLIEGGGMGSGDAHMLMVHTGECVLYELDTANHQSSGWHAYSGAIWDLKTNSTRPTCWTSADAAGLPIFPGLARYEEAKTGAIDHALRFTATTTQRAFVPPAGHYASSDTSPSQPPMGLRLRLKSSFDISGASPQSKIILTALQKYGMILADNGTSWFISGASDANWSDNDLNYLKTVPGNQFEAVKIGPLTTSCP